METNNVDRQYLNLIDHVLTTGTQRENRTGIDTIGIFGAQMQFDLQDGFPLLTTKKVHFPAIAHELLWFISGSTNIKYLKENKVKIWDEWADENGDLGPVYSDQWRSFRGVNYNGEPTTIDQLQLCIDMINNDPTSRRIIVDAWNPPMTPDMALPPCHLFYQFYVSNNELSLHFLMRSVDVGLGLPFNIASYALLTHMVANITGLKPGKLVFTGSDVHIYTNQIEPLKEQMTRTHLPLPSLKLSSKRHINDFVYDDFQIMGYSPHPAIKMKVAV